MRKKLQQLLQSADLRDEEIHIYLVLLRLRRASIPQIISQSAINAMTVYRTVKRLQDRGLVGEVPLNDKQSLYEPLSLRGLISRMDKEQRRLRKLELELMNLDRLLPYIDVRSDVRDDSEDEIQVRQGIDAFKEEYLRFPEACEHEYLHIGSMHNYWKTAKMTYECPEERAFINGRLARNIHCRVFNTATRGMDEVKKNDTREKRITRLVDELPIKENYLGMTENYACHFICDETNPRVIVIRQPELLQMYKNQFVSMWEKGV